ncbi:MAG: cysteine--tRNA ligase [Bacteroidales bacterium]|nr:cysteine--tRNA ligase [Bacteroidales bacterium]
MNQVMYLYNSLTRRKEKFEPLYSGSVGMYVCGPTVYGDPHLGHARPAVVFDVLYRYLTHVGYRVRYVRNITDVGHLEGDGDEGEDKIQKKARLEQLEPMEVAQYYTRRYHHFLEKLNVLPPSIEPYATGHIPEQIEMIEKILESGFAYESNGSIYFDVRKFAQSYPYGQLSGRDVDELMAQTRELEGTHEKKDPLDFALWKKAPANHLMKWRSPWSVGFPGWHLECSVMSTKYLGETFDIHGGGMDLMFPHHECEIAQSLAASGKNPVRYWIHNNLITIDGQKMSKSLNNFITLEEIFEGKHPKLSQPYDPMVIRFFILQAHYRSTLDFSDEALQAADKAFYRFSKAFNSIDQLIIGEPYSDLNLNDLVEKCEEALSDDLNTPVVISYLFEIVHFINHALHNHLPISESQKIHLQNIKATYVEKILGLKLPQISSQTIDIDKLMSILIETRKKLRLAKHFELADYIRDQLQQNGIMLKDFKDQTTWEKL